MTQSIKIVTEPDVIDVSNIVVGHGQLPRRIVIRKRHDSYITHMEILAVSVVDDTVTFTHEDFSIGHYFDCYKGNDPETVKEKAYYDFFTRSRRLMGVE